MDVLRFGFVLAMVGAALGGCIEGQFVWTLTSEESSALRAAASVTAAPESQAAPNGQQSGWRMVCQRDVLPETRACALRAALDSGATAAVAVWPAEDFAALYGREGASARLLTADGAALAPARCLPRPGRGFVCVYSGGVGRQLLADLRAGRQPQVETGGLSAALPEGFGAAERAYARESRAWLELNGMQNGGGGGSGGM